MSLKRIVGAEHRCRFDAATVVTPTGCGNALNSGELVGLPPGVPAAWPIHGFHLCGLPFRLRDLGLQRLELALQQLGLSLQARNLLRIGQRLWCRRAES
jgi:hypothetical protein